VKAAPAGALAALAGRGREEAEAAFRDCCGSRRWAGAMAAAGPYSSAEDLHLAAEAAFDGLGPEDWREAFGAHPRIGEREPAAARPGGQEERARAWSAGEQARAKAADPETLAALAAGNREYEERFGHVFLICATGRSAAEVLAALRERLGHDPEAEHRTAAAEQRKITRDKLLARLEGASP
jgi:OHCU decarboxylase